MYGPNVVPWLAILVATVASFITGAIWYSLLFGRIWMREAGINPENTCQKRNPAIPMVATFLLNLLSISVLSFCLAPKPGVLAGVVAGLVVGLGFVAPSIATNYLFEGKSFTFFAINAGHHIVRFLVAGIVLGLMQ